MIYVMSDIHGRKDRFDCVMKKIRLQKTDRLYMLGDVIDRNPDGLLMLRQIARAGNITMLLGNHEYMMLDALAHPDDEDIQSRWRIKNGGDITFRKWQHCSHAFRSEILAFLNGLPLNIDVHCAGTDWLLVHGAPVDNYNNSHNFLKNRDIRYYAVWHRLTDEEPMPEGKTVIFGHTPTKCYQQSDPMSVYYGDRRIGIDCGCAYPDGRLACLRLDDGAVFYSD